MKEMILPFSSERLAPIDMLVIHSNAFSGEKLVEIFNENHVSSHYILDDDATLIKVVEEAKSAHHAGEGFWRGSCESINNRSIGIEICNSSLGQEPYSENQIVKLIAFARKLVRKYNIPACNIVGHSDVAPLRKADPGLAFPWKRLAREGLGLWYEPKNSVKMAENDIVKLLDIIGYDTRGEEAIQASAYAFCRRFLPQFVSVVPNVSWLVDHVLPENFDFMENEKFLQILKAVAYSYQQQK